LPNQRGSPANGRGLAARAVRLSSSYELFHKRLDELAWEFHLFIHTLVTFSDSAYLVTPDQRIAQEFAMDMIGYCYKWQIPLRGGELDRHCASTTSPRPIRC